MQIPNKLVYDLIYTELTDIVGQEHLTRRRVDKLAYAVDYSWVSQMWIDRGQEPPTADFILFPQNAQEISEIIRVANTYHLSVVPWGGASGSQGGVIPLYGGIIIDIKRLNHMIEIDEESLTVTAEAGIIGQKLEWELNERGLTLAHYPASEYAATLGGYIAARGSGTLSTKYGKAEDMVMWIKLVSPTGEIIETLPVPNHASGPGLLELFVGSEGTFGIIVEVKMRVDPLPEERRFQSFLFEDLNKGIEAGRRIMAQRLNPCVIRLYDEVDTKKYVKRVLNLDVTGSYMVIGVDGIRELNDVIWKKIFEICKELGGKDLGSEAGQKWWDHRYDFYYPPHVKALPKLFGTIETVTTFKNIKPLYYATKEIIEKQYADHRASFFAHFSHWYPWGVMVYAQFMVDEPPQDPEQALDLHNHIWADVAKCFIAHGGVLNEHHGIGLKLGWLMRKQYGPAWPKLVQIKNALDPNGIMNPGKLGFGPPK
jgi:alkyldihydroxyacetonephosphate synthase